VASIHLQKLNSASSGITGGGGDLPKKPSATEHTDSLTSLLVTKDPRLLDQMEIVYRDQALWLQEQLRKEKLVAGKFRKVLTETELEELKEIFRLVDTDDSGEISSLELGMMLETIGLPASEDDIQKMMVEVDTDQSGEIDFNEFVTCMSRSVEVEYSARELKKAFRELITNETEKGTLHTNTLREALATFGNIDKDRIEDLVTTVDPFGEGTIRFLNFVNMMSSSSSNQDKSDSNGA